MGTEELSLALIKGLRDGDITPDEAMSRLENTGTPLHRIKFGMHTDPLPCGFPTIEAHKYLRLGRPDLVIMASRPGVGKTSFACQLALNVAKWGNARIFSVEMDEEELMLRFLSMESEKPLEKLSLPVNSYIVDQAVNRFANYSLTVDDTNGISINDLIARTMEAHAKKPLDLVVVDYLQIVGTVISRSKQEEVLFIAEKLKTLAKALKCPVLAVAQMNRQFDGRLAGDPEARPIMADMADSAGIEKWADTIMCLHRVSPDRTKVYLLKNRHGATEDFTLAFSGSLTKFYDKV